MTKILTTTLLVALATPALAGGPVIIEEEGAPEVIAERPATSFNPIIPLLILLAVGIAANAGSDDPADPELPPVEPK